MTGRGSERRVTPQVPPKADEIAAPPKSSRLLQAKRREQVSKLPIQGVIHSMISSASAPLGARGPLHRPPPAISCLGASPTPAVGARSSRSWQASEKPSHELPIRNPSQLQT